MIETAKVGLQRCNELGNGQRCNCRCMSGWSGLLLTGHFGVRFGKLESENLKLVVGLVRIGGMLGRNETKRKANIPYLCTFGIKANSLQ